MTNQSTMDKLIEMRLTTMADAFRNQLNDPKFKEVPFEDQFGMLVDIEYSSRKNNRLKRLIKNAGFDQPEANIIPLLLPVHLSLARQSKHFLQQPENQWSQVLDKKICRCCFCSYDRLK